MYLNKVHSDPPPFFILYIYVIVEYMLDVDLVTRPDIYQLSQVVFTLLKKPNPVSNLNVCNFIRLNNHSY